MKRNERKGMFHNTSNQTSRIRNKKIFSFSLVMIIFLSSFSMIIIIMPGSIAPVAPENPDPLSVEIKGIGDCRDNYMRQLVGFKETNYGTEEYIWIDANGDLLMRNRGLIEFDISENLPVGVDIQSADLTLFFYGCAFSGIPPYGDTMELYKLRSARPWGEVSSCWKHYWSTNEWTTGGAGSKATDIYDYCVTTTVPGSVGQWMSWNVLFDVNGFYSGQFTNNGWLIGYEDETGGERISKFRSSEFTGTTYDPNLTIAYFDAPECQTNAATSIGETTATLNGYLSYAGASYAKTGFWYSFTDPTPDAGDTNVSAGNTDTETTFNKAIIDLTPGERYYAKAWAYHTSFSDAADNVVSFLTKPNAITDFTATTHNSTQINLTWTNDATATGAYIEYAPGGSVPTPWNPGSGTIVSGTGATDGYVASTSFYHKNLNPLTTYYYKAWSYAEDGGWKSSVGNTSAPFGDSQTDNAATSAPPSGGSSDAGANVTYFFSSYFEEEWTTDPGRMTDGENDTYASTEESRVVQLCDRNTCPGTDLGTIIKVEIRARGYYSSKQSANTIILRPVFQGGDGTDHIFSCGPGVDEGDWSEWFDITTDGEHAPATWTWDDVHTLGCDVEAGDVAKFVLYCARVEIKVSYMGVIYFFSSYHPGEQWTEPNKMINGEIEEYAFAPESGLVQLCDRNTCPGTDLGNIIKVEIRAYGKYATTENDIILRPVFKGGDGTDHSFSCGTEENWSEWFDITTDGKHAPGSWDWGEVHVLGCDVEAGLTGSVFTLYCSKVDIGITYDAYIDPTADGDVSKGDPNMSEVITFDASSSTAPSGEVTEVNWTMGNGDTFEGDPETYAIMDYNYSYADIYNINLRVKDDHGNYGYYNDSITVTSNQTISLVNNGINYGANYVTWGAKESIKAGMLASDLGLDGLDTIQKYNESSGSWSDIHFTVGFQTDNFTINRWDTICIDIVESEVDGSFVPDSGVTSTHTKTMDFTSGSNQGYDMVPWTHNYTTTASAFAASLNVSGIAGENVEIFVYDTTYDPGTSDPSTEKVYNPSLASIGFPTNDFTINPYDVIILRAACHENIYYDSTDFYQ